MGKFLLMLCFACGAIAENVIMINGVNTTANDDEGPSNSSFISQGSQEIRVAVLGPRDIPLLEDKMGFATSAGAINIALDRINREQLLPGAKWSFYPGFTQCEEATAAGALIDLIERKDVHVLLGPPCSVTAIVSAVICKYYNKPMFSWASASVLLADSKRYDTLTRVISSALRLGRAIKDLFEYLNWRRFALLYTDDKAARKCFSIAEGLRKAIANANVINVFNMAIDAASPSDVDLDKFLDGMPGFTRISIICMEHENDMRRMMLRAQQKGLTGPEYVYLVPDFVRDQNRSELWTQYSGSAEQDDRDVEAKDAFKPVYFLEMLLSNADEVHFFKKQVVQRIKEWPFFYDSKGKTNEQYGSLYSPFLHDAFYTYALALNRTMRYNGNIDEGTVIMNMSRNTQFLGVSGHVIIDETSSREPNFVLKGFDGQMRQQSFIELLMSQKAGERVNMLVPERVMWEMRKGFVPVDTPKCGLFGELCLPKSNTNSIIVGAIMAVVAALLITTITIIVILGWIRRRVVTNEMARLLWKVEVRELLFLNDKERQGKSCTSMATVTTSASDATREAIAKGQKNCAHLRGLLCWTKTHGASMVLASDEDHMHLKVMRDLTHDNLNIFVGLCFDASAPMSIWRYNVKGSLEDVLQNDSMKLDWFFKYSLIKDVANGMEYLHESAIQTHGRLRSSNCLVDSRWVVKITDYGLFKMRVNIKEAKDKLWSAPEFLRMMQPPFEGTQPGDVYSFSIVAHEILSRDRPYSAEMLEPGEIILRVAKCEQPPFRPTLATGGDSDTDPAMIQLIKDCWLEAPDQRPSFKNVKSHIKKMVRGRTGGNLMDHILKSMEKHAINMETTINDRTKQLVDEAKKADMLLYRMLPKEIALKIKAGQSIEPEQFNSVSVMAVEMANFYELSEKSSALQSVMLLNDLYAQLDEMIGDLDCIKMDTIGDGYMLVSGAPTRNGNLHAANIADIALQFVNTAHSFFIAHMQNEKVQLRVGMHSGPAAGGVVGRAMPRYCVFGEVVQMAQRMEHTGKVGCVQITETSNKILTEVLKGYITKARGEVNAGKGKGSVFSYWLLGTTARNITDHTSSTSEGHTTLRTDFSTTDHSEPEHGSNSETKVEDIE